MTMTPREEIVAYYDVVYKYIVIEKLQRSVIYTYQLINEYIHTYIQWFAKKLGTNVSSEFLVFSNIFKKNVYLYNT